MKVLFIMLFLYSSSSVAEAVKIVSGQCGSDQLTSSQGIGFKLDGKSYIVASDIFVIESKEACHKGYFAKKEFPLNLIKKDTLNGLALFESPLNQRELNSSNSITRKLKVESSDGDLSSFSPLEVLQKSSGRSFFPHGQKTIEGKANLSPNLVGSGVFKESGEIIGVVSRYQLIFQTGSGTFAERVSLKTNIEHPVVITWGDVIKWVRADKINDYELLQNNSEVYQVRVGNLLFTEIYWRDSSVKPIGPIGGFDGYGIGGFESLGVTGYTRPETFSSIEVEILDGQYPSAGWSKKIEELYFKGAKLRLTGLRRMISQEFGQGLFPVRSLDHYFRMMNIDGSESIFRWVESSMRKRDIEKKVYTFFEKYRFYPSWDDHLSSETIASDADWYHNHLISKMFILVLASPYPEDFPMKEWKFYSDKNYPYSGSFMNTGYSGIYNIRDSVDTFLKSL